MTVKFRIVLLLVIALILLGSLLLIASLVDAQDYEHPVKPTDGGPIWLCPQFGDGACAWLVTETPAPVPLINYEWFRQRIREWFANGY